MAVMRTVERVPGRCDGGELGDGQDAAGGVHIDGSGVYQVAAERRSAVVCSDHICLDGFDHPGDFLIGQFRVTGELEHML